MMRKIRRSCYWILCGAGGIALLFFVSSQLLLYDSVYYEIPWFMKGPLEPNNTLLVKYTRKHLLWPPSNLPYNLNNPKQVFYFEDEAQTPEVVEALFHQMRGGIFVEAGAFDGEDVSFSLYFEKTLGWTGLLVEPNADFLPKLKSKHRKAVIFPGCLGIKPYPEQVNFTTQFITGHYPGLMEEQEKGSKFYKCIFDGTIAVWQVKENESNPSDDFSVNCERADHTIKVQCLALETLLLAANISTVDILSLDVEGAETGVLANFPFAKFHIKVIRVEVLVVDPQNIRKIMLKTGLYRELDSFKGRKNLTDGDLWFVRNDFPVGEEFTLREL